jgi:hypothetical protein
MGFYLGVRCAGQLTYELRPYDGNVGWSDLLGVGVLSTRSCPGFAALGQVGAIHPPQDDDIVE